MQSGSVAFGTGIQQDTIAKLEKEAIADDEYDTAHISIDQMVACEAHHIA